MLCCFYDGSSLKNAAMSLLSVLSSLVFLVLSHSVDLWLHFLSRSFTSVESARRVLSEGPCCFLGCILQVSCLILSSMTGFFYFPPCVFRLRLYSAPPTCKCTLMPYVQPFSRCVCVHAHMCTGVLRSWHLWIFSQLSFSGTWPCQGPSCGPAFSL